MKKIIYAAGVVASLLAISCTKEETFEQPLKEAKGIRIEFAGDSYAGDTKISIGEKDGQAYPLLWQAGDVITAWSADLASADLPTVDAEGNPVPDRSFQRRYAASCRFFGDRGWTYEDFLPSGAEAG